MKTTIKHISILLSFLVICLCTINKTYADDDKDVPKGDDPYYQFETTFEEFNNDIKSIKTLIKNYNIEIKSEKRVASINEEIDKINKETDKKTIVLIMEVPKDKYGDFIKDLKTLTKKSKKLDIIDFYEPITLGATYRTLTLVISPYNECFRWLLFGFISFILFCGLMVAILEPLVKEDKSE